MTEKNLELELRLLILRYGRQSVLRVLARLGDETLEAFEQRLRSGEEARSPKKAKVSVVDLAEVHCREHPELAEPLRALAVGFQNRTFLPQLRDVQRFLDRLGVVRSKLKSRDAAVPVLVRTLAGLSRDDLNRLVHAGSSGESDFSLLARAIMGPSPAAKPSHHGESRDKPAKS